MARFASMNEWTFSGEVFYLKELDKEFGASLKLRGVASRKDDVYSSQIVEVSCLMTKEAYKEAKRKGIARYKSTTLSGHLETFVNGENGKSKVMLIAEYVMEVA